MRPLGAAVLIVLFAATISDAQSPSKTADVKISVVGMESNGNSMKLDCDFNFVAVPSNVFSGACRVDLGVERLSVVSAGIDRQRTSTLLMDRGLTIRALAESGTHRFANAVLGGDAGFPVYIELDPLRRDWIIRRDVPGGGHETIASGSLSSGRITFAIP